MNMFCLHLFLIFVAVHGELREGVTEFYDVKGSPIHMIVSGSVLVTDENPVRAIRDQIPHIPEFYVEPPTLIDQRTLHDGGIFPRSSIFHLKQQHKRHKKHKPIKKRKNGFVAGFMLNHHETNNREPISPKKSASSHIRRHKIHKTVSARVRDEIPEKNIHVKGVRKTMYPPPSNLWKINRELVDTEQSLQEEGKLGTSDGSLASAADISLDDSGHIEAINDHDTSSNLDNSNTIENVNNIETSNQLENLRNLDNINALDYSSNLDNSNNKFEVLKLNTQVNEYPHPEVENEDDRTQNVKTKGIVPGFVPQKSIHATSNSAETASESYGSNSEYSHKVDSISGINNYAPAVRKKYLTQAKPQINNPISYKEENYLKNTEGKILNAAEYPNDFTKDIKEQEAAFRQQLTNVENNADETLVAKASQGEFVDSPLQTNNVLDQQNSPAPIQGKNQGEIRSSSENKEEKSVQEGGYLLHGEEPVELRHHQKPLVIQTSVNPAKAEAQIYDPVQPAVQMKLQQNTSPLQSAANVVPQGKQNAVKTEPEPFPLSTLVPVKAKDKVTPESAESVQENDMGGMLIDQGISPKKPNMHPLHLIPVNDVENPAGYDPPSSMHPNHPEPVVTSAVNNQKYIPAMVDRKLETGAHRENFVSIDDSQKGLFSSSNQNLIPAGKMQSQKLTPVISTQRLTPYTIDNQKFTHKVTNQTPMAMVDTKTFTQLVYDNKPSFEGDKSTRLLTNGKFKHGSGNKNSLTIENRKSSAAYKAKSLQETKFHAIEQHLLSAENGINSYISSAKELFSHRNDSHPKTQLGREFMPHKAHIVYPQPVFLEFQKQAPSKQISSFDNDAASSIKTVGRSENKEHEKEVSRKPGNVRSDTQEEEQAKKSPSNDEFEKPVAAKQNPDDNQITITADAPQENGYEYDTPENDTTDFVENSSSLKHSFGTHTDPDPTLQSTVPSDQTSHYLKNEEDSNLKKSFNNVENTQQTAPDKESTATAQAWTKPQIKFVQKAGQIPDQNIPTKNDYSNPAVYDSRSATWSNTNAQVPAKNNNYHPQTDVMQYNDQKPSIQSTNLNDQMDQLTAAQNGIVNAKTDLNSLGVHIFPLHKFKMTPDILPAQPGNTFTSQPVPESSGVTASSDKEDWPSGVNSGAQLSPEATSLWPAGVNPGAQLSFQMYDQPSAKEMEPQTGYLRGKIHPKKVVYQNHIPLEEGRNQYHQNERQDTNPPKLLGYQNWNPVFIHYQTPNNIMAVLKPRRPTGPSIAYEQSLPAASRGVYTYSNSRSKAKASTNAAASSSSSQSNTAKNNGDSAQSKADTAAMTRHHGKKPPATGYGYGSGSGYGYGTRSWGWGGGGGWAGIPPPPGMPVPSDFQNTKPNIPGFPGSGSQPQSSTPSSTQAGAPASAPAQVSAQASGAQQAPSPQFSNSTTSQIKLKGTERLKEKYGKNKNNDKQEKVNKAIKTTGFKVVKQKEQKLKKVQKLDKYEQFKPSTKASKPTDRDIMKYNNNDHHEQKVMLHHIQSPGPGDYDK